MYSRFFLCFALLVATAAAAPLDSARIEQLTGLKGSFNPAKDVFKVTYPRGDIGAKVEGRALAPFMGFTSWAAFKAGGKAEAMVMGDLVLQEDEVNPALSAALGAGLEVTALHNHFLFDSPKVYYMHIGGDGPVETLAGGVKTTLAAVAAVRASSPVPAHDFGHGMLPAENTIDTTALAVVFGQPGQVKDGMAKWVWGREVTMDCGCEVGADMGVNTWAAFAGTPADAVVMGDFIVKESELTAVLKSLRHDGVYIAAIHHHMLGETPRMIFLHYYGRGPAAQLAQAVKTALGLTH
ncbi:LppY/LpqO family protein [Opitutus sp. GAS368]|uniref:LppY/LpqO family protein n=1 Tax=Opitutus sp. GAS368 TaxID=1882749 RepID=UPI00087ADF0B|nr:LppY/LpqO family protein [Opitutus sp. GAS368]SDR80167.1 protein of unknown function [Opitutus sp. GAS368]